LYTACNPEQFGGRTRPMSSLIGAHRSLRLSQIGVITQNTPCA